MTPTELKAKIVEMLACDEIHELERFKNQEREPRKNDTEWWKAIFLYIAWRANNKYEEVIAFILNELDKWTND